MKDKLARAGIVVYAIIGIVTFGHAWNRDYSKYQHQFDAQLVGSSFGAAAWPFYWSVVAWEKKL